MLVCHTTVLAEYCEIWQQLDGFNGFLTGLCEEKMQACKITIGEDSARKVSCTNNKTWTYKDFLIVVDLDYHF